MVPEELLEVTRALSCVDICSPNHTELGTLMATSAIFPDGSIDKSFIETATEQLLDSFPLSTFAVVVRCGKEGCYIGKNGGSLQKRPMRLAKPDPVPQRPTNAVAYGSNAERDLDELMLRLGNWSNRSSASQSSEDDSESESESDDEPKPDWGTWAWLPAVHADASKVIDPTGGGNAFLGGLAVGLARGKGLKESAMMGNVSASFAIEQVGMPQLRRNENGLETWNGEVAETRLGRYRERNK
jgi:sugar/nucleoside kinase (ribokinase family)